MATQRVMDHTGDTVHTFDPKDEVAVKEAMERFDKTIAEKGGRWADMTPDEKGNTGRMMTAFDPNVETQMHMPHIKGG